jgi:D-serine deaminase-like pyridoxal phosphate-dependent protein
VGDSDELVDDSVGLLDRRAFGAVLDALGEAGSLELLPTPALICELAVLDENISRLQSLMNAAGLALRPHAKSHKSAFVARRQLDAGAVGICCAKVSEAEALVGPLSGHSRPEILLTSPVATPAMSERVAALARDALVVAAVDDAEALATLADAASRADATIGVVCDVDVGLGRTGVATASDAVEIATEAARRDTLRFVGLQGYAGHAQHASPRDARGRAAAESAARLDDARVAVEGAGLAPDLLTGGGTGTWMMDQADGVITEIQAGSYVFMDREYRDAIGGDPEDCFGQSLFVLATVISANQKDFVTVDAGLKSMATDAGPPVLGDMAGTYAFFGDEQGLVTRGDVELRRGSRLRLVPPHCDPTVNLYDHMWLVNGDRVLGVAAVTARGRSY